MKSPTYMYQLPNSHHNFHFTPISSVHFTQLHSINLTQLFLLIHIQHNLQMDDSSKVAPPTNSRPLGGTEYSWYRAVPSGTGITVLALLFSRPLNIPLLQNALRNLQNSHPILLSSLTSSTIHYSSTSPAQIETRVPFPDSSFHSILEHELNQNPWAHQTDNNDVMYANIYELPEGPVVTLRLHTAVCDRTSGVRILKELMGLMGGEQPAVPVVDEGNLGIEELIPKEGTWKPFWAKGKDLVGYSANWFRSSLLRFEDAGSDRVSEVVRLVMGEVETRRLLKACEEKGVKLCGALAAAGLIATYLSKNLENNQPETYSIVTLIDCRKFLEPVLSDHHVGFYHSAILNTHTIRGEGLWEVALRCHNAYSNAISNKKHLTDINELNFLMCKAIDNPHLTTASSLRTALISVFEEPVVYETCELQRELGVEDYVGCASVHGVGPSIAIFDTIRDGRLDCACVYPSPLHSRKQMSDLVEEMKRILTEGSRDVDERVVEAALC